MTYVINGRLIAEEMLLSIKREVKKQFKITNRYPKIATILIGQHPASKIYIDAKLKAAEKVGIETTLITLKENIDNNELYRILTLLNKREDITGILVQLPLPSHLDTSIIYKYIDYKKDVDALCIYNTGLQWHFDTKVIPCTPQGILYILKRYLDNLCGKKVVIIGRSIIVGRPMASALIKENCTVTIVHSKTLDIKKESLQADILISAVGVPHLVNSSWIKKGTFVVDVGISRLNNKLFGDVDFKDIQGVASFITPVPGGVGPLTVANLLLNTLKLFLIQNNLFRDDTTIN